MSIVAGTAWLFSRAEFAGRFGRLVIDEAGPLARERDRRRRVARDLVLVGDPQPLPNLQGHHPPGPAPPRSTTSSTGTTCAGRPGVFLDRTWRMHPEVCAFVSELAYEDRLRPTPPTPQR